MHRLSRRLEAFSAVADELHSPELKLAALYLQLCTYGPIERFFCETYRPELVVSDRHPLIDTAVYLPLYGRAAAGRIDPPEPPPDLRQRLDAIDPEAHDAVVAWSDALARRLGYETDLWGLGVEMLAMLSRPPDEMLDDFAYRFRVALPEAVVLLEIEVEDALERSSARERSAEQHETSAFLALVRERYDQVLGELEAGAAPVAVDRVSSGGRPVDEVAEEVARSLRLDLPRTPLVP